jgi:hypothetical protein
LINESKANTTPKSSKIRNNYKVIPFDGITISRILKIKLKGAGWCAAHEMFSDRGLFDHHSVSKS